MAAKKTTGCFILCAIVYFVVSHQNHTLYSHITVILEYFVVVVLNEVLISAAKAWATPVVSLVHDDHVAKMPVYPWRRCYCQPYHSTSRLPLIMGTNNIMFALISL